jgi:glycosyltransferase involved in cell wall biosynthesis
VKSIRVGVVIEGLGRGGAERLLVDVARGIDQRRFALHVYTLFSAHRDYAPTLRELGVSEICLAIAGPRRIPSAVLSLRRLFAQDRIDIVHTHLCFAHVAGRIAARTRGLAVVSTAHDADYETVVRLGNPGLTRSKQWLLQRVDRCTLAISRARLVGVSRHVAESMCRRLSVPPDRVRVIYNAVDTGIFRPAAPQEKQCVRSELGVRSGQHLILCAGRMTRQKGQGTLLAAAAQLHPRDCALRVVLVGDGAERSAYAEQARMLGLTDVVTFLGIRSDVPRLMAASDLVVVPSLHEGFGLVLAEALACGVPVVASRTGPMPEVVRDGVTGLLFEPTNSGDLARMMSLLLGDPHRRAEMGRQGRDDACRRFSLPRMVREIEALYEDLAMTSTRRS